MVSSFSLFFYFINMFILDVDACCDKTKVLHVVKKEKRKHCFLYEPYQEVDFVRDW